MGRSGIRKLIFGILAIILAIAAAYLASISQGPSSTQTSQMPNALFYIPFSEVIQPTLSFNVTSSAPTDLTVEGNVTSDAPLALVWHQCSSYQFDLKFKASANVSYVLVKGLILSLVIGGNVWQVTSNVTLKVEAEASRDEKITVDTCRDLPKFNEKHCLEIHFGLEVESEVHHDSVTEESNPVFTLKVAGRLCSEKTGKVHLAEYNLCLKYPNTYGCLEIHQHLPHREDIPDEPQDDLPQPDDPEAALMVVGWSRNGPHQTVTLGNAAHVSIVSAYAVSAQDNAFTLVQIYPSLISRPGQELHCETSFVYPNGTPLGIIAFYQTTDEEQAP